MRDSVLQHKDAATRAAQGISFDPERFGQSLLADLDNELTAFLAKIPAEMCEEYEARYISKTLEWWRAMSRCFSVMITGAGNFNNRRHEKTNAAEHNARQRLQEWAAKVIKRANAQARLRGWDEVERLRNKLEQREELQDQMKAVNKILRTASLSDVEKLDEMMALGISQQTATEAMTPDYFGRIGFADYQLSNNNAEIRRLRGLIASKERNLTKEDRMTDTPFGAVELCYSEERIKLHFNGKPTEKVRAICKLNSYRWSPSQGVWMRQLTDNAIFSLGHTLLPALLAEYEKQPQNV